MTSEFNIAVHALIILNHNQRTVSSEDLAENICTNSARVRKVMAMLKHSGLVLTKEGIDGGYTLAVPGEKINLKQVCRATKACFVSASWKSGDAHKECRIASGMGDLMDEIYGELNQICKDHLEGITIRDLDGEIFED